MAEPHKALVRLRGASLAFGAGPPLLDEVSFSVGPAERIGLVGRNGCGKSTLLRLLAGEIEPDRGEVARAGARVALLAQEVPEGLGGDVVEVIAGGSAEVGALLAAYQRQSQRVSDDAGLRRLEELQAEIEAADAWGLERRIAALTSRLQIPAQERFDVLSGGLKRRALLARALVAAPDLLLLDEPTNHLDIASIEWLEELLLGYDGTVLFVTHDRAFLDRLATRILELDRGRLSDWPGDYRRYVERRRHARTVEAAQSARFDQKLAREEAWIRRGLKARRTRNEGRVRALERMREERRRRRRPVGTAAMQIEGAGHSGRRVIEALDASFAYPGESEVVSALTTTILRGDKVGILGPNGSGKTTLLRLLIGELAPTAGTVRRASGAEVAYFDQHRERLDGDQTVAASVADGNDRLTVGGKTRHVVGYLESFLFDPSQAQSPVRSLSGGERNRLLLARLFARSFNLLVMDEPTNDLDVETLELLETLLVEFDGTLLLVSHDRAFLDGVVTSTLVLEGEGVVVEYAGGYSDWLQQRPPPRADSGAVAAKALRAEERRAARRRDRSRKLTYRERQDLDGLPARIETLETEQAELHVAFADPDFFAREGADAAVRAHRRLASLDEELEEAYARWAELDEIERSGEPRSSS